MASTSHSVSAWRSFFHFQLPIWSLSRSVDFKKTHIYTHCSYQESQSGSAESFKDQGAAWLVDKTKLSLFDLVLTRWLLQGRWARSTLPLTPRWPESTISMCPSWKRWDSRSAHWYQTQQSIWAKGIRDILFHSCMTLVRNMQNMKTHQIISTVQLAMYQSPLPKSAVWLRTDKLQNCLFLVYYFSCNVMCIS